MKPVAQIARQSPVGKLLPNALYLHKSAIDALEPLLRIYEGCARSYLGEIEDANLVRQMEEERLPYGDTCSTRASPTRGSVNRI